MVIKDKLVAASALVLFVVVNTQFIWETWVDIFLIPITLFLAIGFLLLAAFTLMQIFACVFREGWKDRSRLLRCILSTASIACVALFPIGIVDRELFRGEDLLVASHEGAANCTTTLRLKDDGEFYLRGVCFGITETAGTYNCSGDTIWFENPLRRPSGDVYEFAIMRPVDINEPYSYPALVMFKNLSDTMGYPLSISSNRLSMD